MDKEREEILEKLNYIKRKAENDLKNNHPGYENYVIKTVIHYNKKIELTNRQTKEKEKFDLCIAKAQDPETKEIIDIYYLNDEEVDISELMIEYESPEPIKDVVDKTRENDQRPSKQKDKQYEKQDLEELEKETNEKEEKNEKEPTFRTDTSGATSLDQMIDGVTLRNLLNLDGEYEYIKPVNATQLNKFGAQISSQQGIVAIKNNGECKILSEDVIRADRQEGNNSFDKDLNIGNDGNVEYKSNTTSYQIVNRPNYYISVSYDSGENEIGTTNKEIKISKRSGREGEEEVEFELQKKGAAEYEESDARKLRQENEDGIGKSDEIIKKQEKHEKNGCENDRVENIDNYENNNIHEHINENDLIPGTDTTWKEFANMCGYRGKDGIEKAQKEFMNYKEDYPDTDNKEIIEEIQEEIENEMPGPNRNRR